MRTMLQTLYLSSISQMVHVADEHQMVIEFSLAKKTLSFEAISDVIFDEGRIYS